MGEPSDSDSSGDNSGDNSPVSGSVHDLSRRLQVEDVVRDAWVLEPLTAERESRAMAKKGTSKRIEHASPRPKADPDSDGLRKDAASWKSNLARWQEQEAAGSLLSPRRTRTVSKDKSDDDGRTTSRTPSPPLRAARHQPAEEPDSCVISMQSLELDPRVPMTVPKASSMASKAKRAMEHVPLLRPLSTIEDDPEWGHRYDVETKPDLRSEFKELCTLSYPIIFTYVLEFLPGIVSVTLVGHLDSPLTKEYVDGVSLSTMFINLTGIAFGFGLATAMDTLCSQAYGAGKTQKLGIYLQSGLLVLGAAVIPVVLMNWYTAQFLLMMGQPEQVALLAGRFSRIILVGIPFLYVYELFKKLLQAQNVVLPMVYIAVFSNIVNILLGVYLTFYTSLGYDGAAIARTVSNIVLPVCLIPFFMWNRDGLEQWWPGWKLAQALQHLRAFLTLGIPGMFMMLLEWWSFEIMAAFVGLLPNSVVAISVHSVLVGVSTMAFNFFLGISVATNIRVGNFVGSNQPEHAKLVSTLGIVLSLGVSATLAVIIIASRYALPLVFINDPTCALLAGHALLYLMPYQLLDAINSVMQGILRGTGRNGVGATINMFAYFVIGLPFGVYLAFTHHYGVEGMWIGLTAGIASGCVVSLYKIFQTDWDAMTDAARIRTS